MNDFRDDYIEMIHTMVRENKIQFGDKEAVGVFVDKMLKFYDLKKAEELTQDICEREIESCIMYVYDDGIGKVVDYTNNEHKMFYDASEFYAFSDCHDDSISIGHILYCGKFVRYCGWEPDMVFTFTDLDGNVVYSNSFPQWDH